MTKIFQTQSEAEEYIARECDGTSFCIIAPAVDFDLGVDDGWVICTPAYSRNELLQE